MTADLRVAVIGCGHMGTRHARTITETAGARLTVLADIQPGAAGALRDALGAAAHATALATDAGEVLQRDDVDAVVITTRHDSHPDLILGATRAGKHVFVEKPLALSVDACRQIETAVKAAGVILVVGFQARHAPLVQRMRRYLPKPRVVIGQMIDRRWSDDFWANDPVQGGGNVLSQGVHTLDLACYLAESRPVSVYAAGGNWTHDERTTPIDSIMAVVRFANGAAASLTIGDFGPSPWAGKSFYQLFDARGNSATLAQYYETLRLGGEKTADVTKADLTTSERDDYLGYRSLLAEFLDCARLRRTPAIGADVSAGRRATELAAAAFQSVRSGDAVSLPGDITG